MLANTPSSQNNGLQNSGLPNPILVLDSISKSYPGNIHALVDINLAVRSGEIVCLLGPSGCGKTTLLRVVAGLERPDSGRVYFNGGDLSDIPVHRRGFGFMFQDYALFPHRTVAENIAFGLRMAGWSRTQQQAQVAAMLDLVNLPGYGERTIFELSGGERQRVALARSLAPKPALIMLDEPLGSLDRTLREELVEELRRILKETGVTALYVTHDQDEAMALGDRMVIMQRGHIEQVGTPEEVYTHPATPFAARFLGFTNLLPAQPSGSGITTPLGAFPLTAPGELPEQTLLLRPEAARLAPPAEGLMKPGFHPWDTNGEIVLLHGRLLAATYHGSDYRIEVSPEMNTEMNTDMSTGPITNPGAFPGFKVPNLVFLLPAYQRAAQGDTLNAIKLPVIGEPIQLLIYTDLATLLPYRTFDP
jgi:ABC-type Fe3+/spermidine/putrescine transport system ATPase subunit